MNEQHFWLQVLAWIIGMLAAFGLGSMFGYSAGYEKGRGLVDVPHTPELFQCPGGERQLCYGRRLKANDGSSNSEHASAGDEGGGFPGGD
jgi:hypothetical protein